MDSVPDALPIAWLYSTPLPGDPFVRFKNDAKGESLLLRFIRAVGGLDFGLSVTDGSGTLPCRIAASRMDPKTGERIFVFSKVPLPSFTETCHLIKLIWHDGDGMCVSEAS
jgi:hypothetical protein